MNIGASNREIHLDDCTVLDRGSDLSHNLMTTKLRDPWSIGTNERSHKFIKKALDKILNDANFECGPNYEILLGEVEMAWNFTQHKDRTLPNFSRYGVISRALGELDHEPTKRERIALMEMARAETE